jgi:predicted SAM-dependent methyltransferase
VKILGAIKRAVLDQKSDPTLKLHLGCGPVILEGWVNIDAAPQQDKVVAMRLPDGLRQFEDCSARFIYASHVVEHLDYRTEAPALVKECHRVLASGGVWRIIVPGIEGIIRAYVADDEAFFKVQETMHPEWCTTKMEHLMYALQQDGEHKYGYDFATMKKLLSAGGFKKIVNSAYNKSTYPELRVDYRGENLSLFVEAVKE